MTGVGSSPTRVTSETSQVLLAGVSGGFSRGTPFSPHLLIGSSRYEWNNLERDVKLNKKKKKKNCLNVLYKCMKFRWSIINGYQVIERTPFCDGQTGTDARGKNHVSPGVGGHKRRPPSQIILGSFQCFGGIFQHFIILVISCTTAKQYMQIRLHST